MEDEPERGDRAPAKAGERGRYHHGGLRLALIEAAMRIIEETRLEAFAVADAARAAGVSSGAPYRHFADRDELLDAVAARAFEEMGEANRVAFSAHPRGSLEALIAGGRSYVSFAAARPELFHLMWGATRPNSADGAARESGDRCHADFMDALAATMAAQGLERLEPRPFGEPLWAMVHGFASLVATRNEKMGDLVAVHERIDSAVRAYFAGTRALQGESGSRP